MTFAPSEIRERLVEMAERSAEVVAADLPAGEKGKAAPPSIEAAFRTVP